MTTGAAPVFTGPNASPATEASTLTGVLVTPGAAAGFTDADTEAVGATGAVISSVFGVKEPRGPRTKPAFNFDSKFDLNKDKFDSLVVLDPDRSWSGLTASFPGSGSEILFPGFEPPTS